MIAVQKLTLLSGKNPGKPHFFVGAVQSCPDMYVTEWKMSENLRYSVENVQKSTLRCGKCPRIYVTVWNFDESYIKKL